MLLSIPTEILCYTLLYVDVPTLKRIRLTCRQLNGASMYALKNRLYPIVTKVKESQREYVREAIVWQLNNTILTASYLLKALKLTCRYNLLDCFYRVLYLIRKGVDENRFFMSPYFLPGHKTKMEPVSRILLFRYAILAYILYRPTMLKELLVESRMKIYGAELLTSYLKCTSKGDGAPEGIFRVVTLRRIIFEYGKKIRQSFACDSILENDLRNEIHEKDLIKELKILIEAGILNKNLYRRGLLNYRGPYSYKNDRYHSNSCTRYACKRFNLTPVYVGYVKQTSLYRDDVHSMYITLKKIPVGIYSTKHLPHKHTAERRVDELLIPSLKRYLILYRCDHLDDSMILMAGTCNGLDGDEEYEAILDHVVDDYDVYVVDMDRLKERDRIIIEN